MQQILRETSGNEQPQTNSVFNLCCWRWEETHGQGRCPNLENWVLLTTGEPEEVKCVYYKVNGD